MASCTMHTRPRECGTCCYEKIYFTEREVEYALRLTPIPTPIPLALAITVWKVFLFSLFIRIENGGSRAAKNRGTAAVGARTGIPISIFAIFLMDTTAVKVPTSVLSLSLALSLSLSRSLSLSLALSLALSLSPWRRSLSSSASLLSPRLT